MSEIIKTFWYYVYNRLHFDRGVFLCSFVLGTLMLCREDNFRLITDEEGKRLMIDELKLPIKKYTVVNTVSSYKAINDLNVLSTFNTPVIFINDNILVSSKLRFNIADRALSVVGHKTDDLEKIRIQIKLKRNGIEAPPYEKAFERISNHIDTDIISISNIEVFEVLRNFSYFCQGLVNNLVLKQLKQHSN